MESGHINWTDLSLPCLSLTVVQLAFFGTQSYQIYKHDSTNQSKYWTEWKITTQQVM